ncbi:MAG: hypothetical protein GC153_08275 [Alphaproteobacteria bacterium]|nr:hypothetical protein [Alphaproteobacteria bacterium]
MYERRSQPPISRKAFIARMTGHVGIVCVVILASLGAGMAGFVLFEKLPPADAFLHAASLLGGMGFVETPDSLRGKLFAGVFALYAGLVFIASFGILLAPVLHRLLHKFHWEDDESDSG